MSRYDSIIKKVEELPQVEELVDKESEPMILATSLKKGLMIDPLMGEHPIARTARRLPKGVEREDSITVEYDFYCKKELYTRKLLTTYLPLFEENKTKGEDALYCPPTPYIYDMLPAIYELWKEQGFQRLIKIPSVNYLCKRIGHGRWDIANFNLLGLVSLCLTSGNMWDRDGEKSLCSFDRLIPFKGLYILREKGTPKYKNEIYIKTDYDFGMYVKRNLALLDSTPESVFRLPKAIDKRMMVYMDRQMIIHGVNEYEQRITSVRDKKLEAFRKVFFLPEDNRKMMNELNKIYDNLETVGFLKKMKEKDRFEKRSTGLWMRFERAIPHDYKSKRKGRKK